MNRMVHNQKPLSSAHTVFPLGYDPRRKPRFSLDGGGYIALCARDDSWFDALRAPVRINVRDIAVGGVGLLSRTAISSGHHLIMPTPSGYLLRIVVVCQSPDPLFPKLHKLGCRWCSAIPMKVLAEWEPYIQTLQLKLFHEITGMAPPSTGQAGRK